MQKLRRRPLRKQSKMIVTGKIFTDMGSYLTTEKHNFVKTDFNFLLFQNLREEEEEEEEVEGIGKGCQQIASGLVLEWSKQASSKNETNKKIPA